MWTWLLVLSSETTAAAAALVPASIASSCCVTQPSSVCSPVTQGLVRVAKSWEQGLVHPDKAFFGTDELA